MNFFSWMYEKQALDEKKELPPGMTLEEHRKVCKAEKGKCPFEVPLDSVDDITESSLGMKRKPITIDDLADLYEDKGVTEELVEAATGLYKDIVAGHAEPVRLPREVFQNEDVKTLPKWMLLGYLVGAAYGRNASKVGKVLDDFAKASGAYIADTDEYFDKNYGKDSFIANGMEASVYRGDEGKVVKKSTLDLGTENDLHRIERIMLSNIFFPETAYTPLSLGRNSNDEREFVLSQREIQMGEEGLSEDQIEEWMKEKGWKMADPFLRHYTNEDTSLACMDVHGDNLVKDVDGNIVCIDPCVLPNTMRLEMKGRYDYDNPPKDFNSRK